MKSIQLSKRSIHLKEIERLVSLKIINEIRFINLSKLYFK